MDRIHYMFGDIDKIQQVEGLFEDLSDLLNQQSTKRTFIDDLTDVSAGLSNLKERIDSSENKDVYEEDKINLGWALDFIDYLYKIYSVVYDEGEIDEIK